MKAALSSDQAKRLSSVTLPGGHAVVLRHPRQGGYAELVGALQATPGIKTISADDNHRCCVLRTRVWGFPDIVEVWQTPDGLGIAAHLVIGRSDLGVNKARITRWLTQSGIAPLA